MFSPVLYLRGLGPADSTSGAAASWSRRSPAPTGGQRARCDPAPRQPPATRPSRWCSGAAAQRIAGADALRADLVADLAERGEGDAPSLDLSALAERFFLHSGRGKLQRLFQKTIGTTVELEAPPFIRAIARALRPGAHTTLLWLPFLE